jgi:hypothetical protein
MSTVIRIVCLSRQCHWLLMVPIVDHLELLWSGADLQYFYLLLNGYILITVLGPVMYNLWIFRVRLLMCYFTVCLHMAGLLISGSLAVSSFWVLSLYIMLCAQ